MTFKEEMEEEGYISVTQAKNGVWVALMSFMYTYSLCVGLDSSGYKGRYCYEYFTDAMIALLRYSGEGDPEGPWIKYKGEGGERLGPGAKGV